MQITRIIGFVALSITLGYSVLQPARADTVTSIASANQNVTLGRDGKATVAFTVNGAASGSDACGIWINYGDGDSPDTRVISAQEGKFPRVFSHTFNRPGQFAVIAKGERVKSTMACSGQATTTINVVAAGQGRRRDVAAANCPNGWGLVQGSFNRQSGAYTCGPVLPTERMDCGPGLRYFQSGNTLGCRESERGRRN